METGKVEFAPDYKSDSVEREVAEIFAGDMRAARQRVETEVAHARLQSAVVETCSAYCASVIDMEESGWPTTMTHDEWHYQHLQKQTAMIDAHRALIAFEAEHGMN